MFSISSLLLNLYNFNSFEPIDKVLLSVGIPLAFFWLGLAIGMVRLENYFLVVPFVVFFFFQPSFLGYSLYSAIEIHSNDTSTISSTRPTTTNFVPFITSESTTKTIMTSTAAPMSLIPVPTVLYVCIGVNIFTHLASFVVGFVCMKNYGKGLKERIFNNQLDKWFQKHLNRT